MCTWAVVETIGYYMKNGSKVFTCMMDMTKAFNLVKHSIMFRKLIKANLSPIFIRLIICVYMHQVANVRWNGTFSEFFTMRNGVRQGAVLSVMFYCIYVNEIFTRLRNTKQGCWVNEL